MTGYPIVDAGMRQLWKHGYMHNRVRIERSALQFRMVLNADEPRMVWVFDRFRQKAVR